MSTEMINFLTKKFKTALEEVEKGGQTEFPLRKIFQDISLVLEMKVTSSIHIQPGDSLLMACLYSFNDAITECRLLYEARRRRALAHYTLKEWYQLRRIKGWLLETLKHLRSVTDAGLSTSVEGNSNTANQQIDPGLFERSKIYGFDERMEDIVTSLWRNGESGINKIGVVGIGGSGKTALCQLVYNNPVVKREFIPRIWVGLPNKFESATDVTRTITEYILKELGAGEEDEEDGDDGVNSASLDMLLVTLHRHLSGKKYLIVFDNVWDVNSWYDKLVNMSQMTTQQGNPLGLPKGYGGGIIITSRLEGDVKHIVGEENLHYPPTLDQEDCWSIFLDEIKKTQPHFFQRIPWNSEMIGRVKTEIIQNCNGLPSAAKTLAHIFADPLPPDEYFPTEPRNASEFLKYICDVPFY